jgi:hypothetical protein
MSAAPTDLILESAMSSFRERDSGGRILPSPAWWDLSPEDRDTLFRRQLESRILERALDPARISSTARAVLSRIR